MSHILAIIIGIIIGGICFGRETDWKCDNCVNNGCVANDSICDDCDGENHFIYDNTRKEQE